MGAIGDIFLRLRADLDQFETDIQKAGDNAGKTLSGRISNGLNKAGKSITQAGKTLTTNLTLPVVALGAAVFKVGSDFETTLNQIVGLTDVTKEEIGGVREEILAMGEEIGKTPQELAEGFYFLASAGFNTAEAMEVLKTTAMASAAGLGTTADVSRVIGAAINAFGRENLTAADATDQLLRAINKGTAEAPDFANSLGNVIGTAAQVDATFADTTAAIAGMTIAAIGTEEATTSLNQVYLSLIKTTPQAEAGFQAVGLSAKGLREQLREKGLLSVLQTLTERFKGNEDAAADAFGNVRALRGVFALTGLDAAQLADIFGHVNDGTQNLGEAFEETEGSARDYQRAQASLQALLIELSNDVLPFVVEILREVRDIARGVSDAWRGMSPEVRGVIVRLLGLAAALGPVLFIAGKLTSGLGALFKTFALAKSVLGPATRLFARFGVTLAASLSQGLASSAAVNAISGGLASALDKVPGSSAVKAATSRLGNFLGTGLGKLFSVGFAAAAVVGVIETYNQVATGVKEQSAALASQTAEFVKTATTDALINARKGVQAELAKVGSDPIGEFLGLSAKPAILQTLAQLDAEIAARAAKIPAGMATALEYGQSEVQVAARQMAAGIGPALAQGIDEAGAAAGAAAAELPGDIAAGIRSRRGEVMGAFDQLKQDLENALRPSAERARVVGALLSDELAKGLRSKDPVVKAQAEHTRDLLLTRLNELPAKGRHGGSETARLIAEGLRSKSPSVRRRAQEIKDLIEGQINKIPPAARKDGAATAGGLASGMDSKRATVRTAAARIKTTVRAQTNLGSEARRWGRATGLAYSSGLRSTIESIQTAARLAAGAVRGALRADSPPVVTSPLHFIDKWGERTMEAYAGGLEKGGGRAEAVLHRLLGGPRGFTVPIQASGVISGVGSYQPDSVAGGGVTYNYNMPVQGALPVRTPADAVAAMRRINEHGELPPKFLSPQYPRRESGVRP